MIVKKKHLFIFAGEQSGDLHGSHLMRSIKEFGSPYYFSGVAGPAMRAEGIEAILPMEKFAVMGFSDVFKALPRLYKQFYLVRDYILKAKPEAVLFIDYPGFNLRMAKSLRRAGYRGKLVHYICPSVWAWGKKRIQHMTNTLDMLLTIFPFEPQCFSHTSLNVKYIGNPLHEYISKHPYDDNWKSQFPKLHTTGQLIAIFPGSRLGEIKRNLGKQLQAAVLFQKKYPETVFAISCSNDILKTLIEKMIKATGLTKATTVPKKYTYELMRDCHSAIAKSGTVTLELALHKRPTVVVYELSKLNRFIAKFLIRLNMPHYCIVNILRNKRVFPELIESGFHKENLFLELEKIHTGNLREECLYECKQLLELFHEKEATRNAAIAIGELLQ